MQTSFFFYDLETSGFIPRDARIMQFAGQRTSMSLEPIGEPVNVLIKLTEDVLPDPDAVLVTGITPQQTLSDGITEAQFLKLFYEQVATEGTIFTGYNSVRFDDEFMRFLHYRNFYDPYEWQYTENKSRWDLLDVMRMARALRPEGIQWPFDTSGKPSNRLELLTSVNNIGHQNAHDALADVEALIELARLLQQKQPKLFSYLLEMRDKRKIEALVSSGEPFVYASGKYPSEFEKTTIAQSVAPHPKRQGVLVFDLRYDPTPFLAMNVDQLVEAWKKRFDEEGKLPVKTLQYNRCPAVAPMAVLDSAAAQRIKIDVSKVSEHAEKLKDAAFTAHLCEAAEQLEAATQAQFLTSEVDVDARLYDGFFDRADKYAMSAVRAADESDLAGIAPTFQDGRLDALLPLYKARNFPSSLSDEERKLWERTRERKLLAGGDQSRAAKFFNRLLELDQNPQTTDAQRYILEELQLYAQSVLPTDVD
jgi:exodeoxyribonuclease I